ncbi:peroxisomal multifunctional beta-oxidation protein [Fusarium bulbicola]|nr:peroxisomal multifunctional beta-oxidation protein [Fusarium bulbicola]
MAKKAKPQPTEMSFTDRDIILYNIFIGASASQLPWVFEKQPGFGAIPSFGVIPGTTAARPFDLKDLVPNFSYNKLLHGEHYLEIHKFPIPTSGTFVSESKLIDILDKGKAAVAVIGTTTRDKATGERVFYNELTLFLRGAGGFGGSAIRSVTSRGAGVHAIPDGEPDQIVEEKTPRDQAALYRLNGDRNPLHIDPTSSAAGGFKVPILHGLCSFGIATKHIVSTYGPIFSVKVRFAGTADPGQTLRTKMWLQGKHVVFQTEVKETSKISLGGGFAVFRGPAKTRL